MPFTTPHTWANDDLLTGPLLNTELRDNLLSIRNGNEQYCRLYLSSNPILTNNIDTPISWDKAAFQTGTIWSAANPSRLTAPATGRYLVFVVLEWRSNSNALRNLSILRNAGGAASYPLTSQGAAGGKSNLSAKLPVSLVAGQFLTVQAFQSSGGPLTLHGGAPDRTRVSMLWLGV